MNYRKLIDEDINPILAANSMPFLNKIYKSKLVHCIALILAIIILLGALFHMIFENKNSANKILISRESTLNEEIAKVKNRNDMLEAEILLLKDEVKSLKIKKDNKKIAKISKYVANSEVSDKGLIIVLKDNESDLAPEQEESNLIHNTDLLKIVNFLWEQGATAITINDERIVPNTYISCVGATILINDKQIISPFTIKVTGKNFDTNLVENSSIMLSLKLRGIEFEIEEKERIILPADRFSSSKE